MDLIPFYARLVATLHQCLDDIVPLLVELLVKDFRFQVYKKDQVRIDFKLKNVRFIGIMWYCMYVYKIIYIYICSCISLCLFYYFF